MSWVALPAFAVDRYVDAAAGVDAGVCNVAATPCQTIAYTLSVSGAGDVLRLTSLTGAPMTFFESGLVVPFDVAIVGDGALRTEIDAGGVDRIFQVSADVLIDGLTLRNGDASTGTLAGGAIEVQSGDLIVTRSRLIGNHALTGGAISATDPASDVRLLFTSAEGNIASATGGAIRCDGCGGVDLVLSRLVDNLAGSSGGAIYAFGTAVLVSTSSLSRNNADQGGAVYANFAELHLLDSALADNEADTLDGGAVNIGGTLNIARSTLEGNSAPAGAGGAVYMVGDGLFAGSNSTYSGNTALFGGAFNLQPNFGIGAEVLIGTSTFVGNESTFPGASEHIEGAWNSFELYNSIIAHDPATAVGLDPFCAAPLDDGQHNLIDDASCDPGVAGFRLGQVTGLDFTLRYNGGLTRTHLIDPVSNAVDAGRNPACRNPATGAALVVDQRGRPRPVDFDLNGTAECDIGAVELQ